MPIINPTLPADGDDAIVEPYNAAIQAILGVLNGAIDADNLAAGAVTLDKLATAVQGALVPTGMIAPFGGSTAPTGWLLCNGSSQLRASYSALFAVLGTNYGSADGTHFNLPDLRGRVPVGSDTMGTSAANRSQVTTTITTSGTSTSATVGSATGLAVGQYIKSANVTPGTKITAISGTTITMSAGSTGSGTTIAATFSVLGNDATILGSAGGEMGHAQSVLELAAHAHAIGDNQNANIDAGSLSARLASDIAFSTVSTGSTGGGLPFNVMQPGQVTSYIVKT